MSKNRRWICVDDPHEELCWWFEDKQEWWQYGWCSKKWAVQFAQSMAEMNESDRAKSEPWLNKPPTGQEPLEEDDVY